MASGYPARTAGLRVGHRSDAAVAPRVPRRDAAAVLAATLFILPVGAAAAGTMPPAPLVGAWYFGGWFNCTGAGCYSHFQGFTPRGAPVPDFFVAYPERLPLTGKYDSLVDTVAAEVAAADAGGLDFFHVLFYDDDGEAGCGPNPDPRLSPCLDASLAWMLNSSAVWANATRMRFALAYSNDVDAARAPGMFVGDAGRAEWLSRVGTWVAAMGHPRYLALSGRPIFQVRTYAFAFPNERCHSTGVRRQWRGHHRCSSRTCS